MNIKKDYISNQNSYEVNNPLYIVIHNTDNFKVTADAKAHAKAQHDGNLSGMSAHIYTDDKTAYQALPYNRGAWHVGVNYGKNNLFGTVNNRNSIAIEMCVNSGYNYEKAFQNTVEVTKQIMKELNIPADRVLAHYDVCTKNCPSQIRAKNDWARFKKLIGADGTELPAASGEVVVDKLYRVRKSWEDSASQLGAYTILENAKAACNPGYKVYDWNGEVVCENTEVVTGTQTADFVDLSEKDAAEKLLEICRPVAEKYHLLPSVATAQCILESGYCGTELAKSANNVCGMKCTLSGNTWSGSTWDGKSKVNIRTAEQDKSGNTYYINADFRKYPCIEDSIADRCAYLLGAKNGNNLRYAGITECADYKAQIQLIKAGDYATDVNYVTKICNIIQRYGLDKYDAETQTATPAADPVQYYVRKSWTDKASQIGAYSILDNAKKQVDQHWQYNVYDAAGKELYNGTCALIDRAVSWASDIAADNSHGYNNSGNGWGPDEYNCIGLVMRAYKAAGNDPGVCNIDQMPEYLKAAGFQEVTSSINLQIGKGAVKGDVFWMLDKTGKHGHTEMYCGDGKLVGARGDLDGKAGDSSGNEISVIPYTNMSWQKVFRLPGGYTAEASTNTPSDASTSNTYKVQIGAYSIKANAQKRLKTVKAAGFDAILKYEDDYWRVQCGAFSQRANAEALAKKLRAAGFTAIIKEY